MILRRLLVSSSATRRPVARLASTQPICRHRFASPTLRHFRQSAIMSKPQLDPESTAKVTALTDFWFNLPPSAWFSSSPELDAQIKSQYGELIASARSGALDHWSSTPEGVLALVILLDQFPRNIFRGSNESFSSDAKVLEVVTRAVAQGLDKQLGTTSRLRQSVLYLPFMHAESLLAQVAGVALHENLVATSDETNSTEEERERLRQSTKFAETHMACVAKLGRFPKRNEALGRTTTAEEDAFLEEHPAGF